jgi:hypothetical protein
MAAPAQSAHDVSHVESICSASTNNNNIAALLVNKDSKSDINVKDLPLHADHNCKSIHMSVNIQQIKADLVTV